MFSISVHTSQDSWGKSTGDEDLSSNIGTSELSSSLQSAFDSGHGSFPAGSKRYRALYLCIYGVYRKETSIRHQNTGLGIVLL